MIEEAFQNEMRLGEVGITEICVIRNLLVFQKSHPTVISIRKSPHESKRGADIEIFHEFQKGRYRRYLLQAKMSDANGVLTSLDYKVGKVAVRDQVDVLMEYARSEGAIPLYLAFGSKKVGVLDTGCKLIKPSFVKWKLERKSKISFNSLRENLNFGDVFNESIIEQHNYFEYEKVDGEFQKVASSDYHNNFSIDDSNQIRIEEVFNPLAQIEVHSNQTYQAKIPYSS